MDEDKADNWIEEFALANKKQWVLNLLEIIDIAKRIPLPRLKAFPHINEPMPRLEKITQNKEEIIIYRDDELVLVFGYLSEARMAYVFGAPIGCIALCASAVEYFLKILLYKEFTCDEEAPAKPTLGYWIGLAEKKEKLAGDILRKAQELNKNLRTPYVHSKPEEILEGKKIKTKLTEFIEKEFKSEIAEYDEQSKGQFNRAIEAIEAEMRQPDQVKLERSAGIGDISPRLAKGDALEALEYTSSISQHLLEEWKKQRNL